MNKYYITLLFNFAFAGMTSSQAYDRLWFAGYDEFPGVSGYGHAQIRFANDTVLAEPAQLAFNFESTVAVMSDSAGELLFYTNGCSVANRNHEIMPNGSGLNPGDMAGLVCPWKGYIVPQGAMALPDPAGGGRYYIIHAGGRKDAARKLGLGPLYYTVIDMTLQNGLGDVVSKNNILLDGDLGSFTVVRHGNGRDWWIVVPEFGNRRWHAFLLSPEGIAAQAAQDVFLAGPDCEKFMGTAVSRNGDRIANWGDCKVTVLDFDRCAGSLGRPLELQAPTHWIPGGGVAFSRGGRYLYATSQNVLFRADLSAAAPKLDTMRFSYDPFLKSPYDVPGNTFHFLTAGPDGHIYGNIPSRASHLHVLKNADGATIADIDFRAKGLILPVKGVRTLPHLPNYRLYDWPGSACDTLGISVAAPYTPPAPNCDIQIRPNPAAWNTRIAVTACPDASGAIFDAAGRRIQELNLVTGAVQIELGHFQPGVYFITLYPEKGAGITRRLVVLR